ncbi:DNA helicase subunit AddA [Moorella glycerini]|uniref:ATP-dependent helicase/nuclease subunit A n=1 Tax=Neomoorella stamsii TaxID=1266720 RepID=A0A9X7P7T4_9FIRM|nr:MULTISPECIES: UvrD-helicase domain-containing protein [Moorella]PRR77612.1 ATP-dependent helicase/nuclease subunit A [Moorella stamsii]CEP68525.1 DNA helicase subunit AddA [Moorella glycerini]
MTSEGEKRRWTEEQLAAIRARRANLLVAAAAGAGKTAVLVERIIQRLTDPEAPVSLENLLVVTFTEAAAAEMRQRIGAALEAAVARQPENKGLRRQLLLLNRAHISTIHSFCLWVVRTYFYRLDLDPGFRVMDPAEADLLQLEVMDQVLEECFAAEPEGGPITDLADSLGGRGDANLVELVLKVWEFTRSLPWPEAWLEEAVAAYRVPAGTPLESLPWYREIKEVIALRLQEAAFYLREAMRLAASPGGPAIYLDNLEREESQVAGLLAGLDCLTWNQVCERLTAFSFGRLKAVRGGSVDERLKEKATGYRDQAKKLLKELQEEFCRDEAAIRAELDRVRELVTALVEVVRRFDAAFRELKRRRGLVDFGDLEHLCLQVLLDPEARPGELRPSALAMELRRRFEEVLVDEYQDINSIQDAILALVSRQEVISPCDGPGQASGQGTALPAAAAPNLFMVGDVKQSIYRFRLANPELFLVKYRQYQEREGELNRRILLKANFRSRQGIVDGVNFIFRQVFSPLVGELDYDAAAALVSRAGYPEHPAAATPAIEVYLQERQTGGDGEVAPGEETPGAGEGTAAPLDTAAGGGEAAAAGAVAGQLDPEDLTALEREAWLVARRIRQMVQGTPERPGPECQVWDPERQAYRDVTYRDIVILLRATQDRAPVFIEVLQQNDIPAYADLGSGYFAATEVETILSLLRVIDNPHQDIPLAAVLRSPLVGLTAGELARTRLAAPGEDFFTAVMKAAGAGEEQRVTAGDCFGDSGLGSGAISPVAGELPGRNSCSPAGGVQPPCTSAGGDLPPSSGAEREEGDAAREKDLAARLRGFLARLDRWRTMARRQPLGDLIWQLYRETGYLEFVGGLPGGAQRQANLRALLDRARQFEGFARHGLFRFLRFIERLQQNGGDLGTARALGEKENVVRIMSIHKAKGLEFPVVIVADLGKGFNFQDLSGDVLLHGKLGLAPLYLDAAAGIKYPTLPYLAAAHRLRLEALSEEVRIFYVALTRAREKLILVGSARNLPRQAEIWCTGLYAAGEQLPPMLMARARNHLDWLAAALARHVHGAPLRQLAGVDRGYLLDDPSCWQLEVLREPVLPETGPGAQVSPGVLPPGRNAAAGVAGAAGTVSATTGDGPGGSGVPDEPGTRGETGHTWLRQEVARRLSWVYPWQPLTALPVKLAATDLKRRFDVFNEGDTPLRPGGNGFTRRPVFLQEQQGLTAAERGTATHLVLQHVDLQRPVTPATLAGLLQELVEREILTPEQAAAVDTGAIVTFFAGPLGQRLLARPGKVKRELPFSLAIPAGELYPGLPPAMASGEAILVQGIIDCLVDEEDGFLLLDFKTGKVPPDPPASYQEQVHFYTRAVATIFNRPVKEAHLYFLDGGVDYKVE